MLGKESAIQSQAVVSSLPLSSSHSAECHQLCQLHHALLSIQQLWDPGWLRMWHFLLVKHSSVRTGHSPIDSSLVSCINEFPSANAICIALWPHWLLWECQSHQWRGSAVHCSISLLTSISSHSGSDEACFKHNRIQMLCVHCTIAQLKGGYEVSW